MGAHVGCHVVGHINFIFILEAIYKCQHVRECTNHTLSETQPPFPSPPQKEYTLIFLSAKNPHENNKNQAKKLKV